MADYVVIGGGSSGGVVTNRLSEDPSVSVCLLEAGGSGNSFLVSTPGAFAAVIQDFKFNTMNWNFNTEENRAINNRRLYQPRGKMLGGSSGMNAMVYIRGHRLDYDRWRDLGNEGWGYDDVLPYFRKSEDNERGEDEYHGVGGPMAVSDGDRGFPVYETFLETASALGHKLISDLNVPEPDGLGIYQFTVRNGKRAGVKAAFIDPAIDRENLTVETRARVHRIVLEGDRAVAVEYMQDGEKKCVSVEKEVIVSGGAFNSPQILMLSGVGPRDELEKHGIEVVVELPGVGKNLQDHPDLMTVIKTRKRLGIALNFIGTFKTIRALYTYVAKKQGWLAYPPTAAGGFLRSDPALDRPDFQVHVTPLAYRDHARDYRTMTRWGYSVLTNIGRPKSRGSVTLHDADPESAPRIDLNFLDHRDDLRTLRNAFKVVQEILHTGKMKELMDRPLFPDRYLATNEEIDAYIRREANHAYHASGTCKMGSDGMSVVDSKLRVRGLANVRVADASVMPTLMNGNTNAACIMLGEKAADLIRNFVTQPG